MGTIDYKHAVVVDDDKDIGDCLGELLESRGYRVRVFDAPLQALQFLRSNAAETVGIVFSDLQMPQMEGTEFLRNVAVLRPGTLRVLTSAAGHADRFVDGRIIHLAARKPFDFEDLLRQIEERAQQRRESLPAASEAV